MSVTNAISRRTRPSFPNLAAQAFPARWSQLLNSFFLPPRERSLSMKFFDRLWTAGEVVICDRFADSTTAYQGYGRELPLEQVNKMNEVATGGLKPNLTILLDIDADAGLSRVPEKKDRMEKQARDFHRRVREGYLEIAKGDPDRFLKLDAKLPAEELQVRIWRRVEAAPVHKQLPGRDSAKTSVGLFNNDDDI